LASANSSRIVTEDRAMDEALNIGFFVVHTSWIAFVCTGWAWERARIWHLTAVGLTALSWFGLGLWFGWGYCPCTDWHWTVRARLGYRDPPSYIQLLIGELTGVELEPELANMTALATLLVTGILTGFLNLRDRRRRR
jgi:hypothetical protein